MNRSLFSLILSFVLLVAALSGYFVFYHAVNVLGDKVTTLRTQIAVKSAVSGATPASIDSAAITAAKREAVQYFVDPSGIADFLGGLESIGTTTGAHVAVVSVAEDKKSSGRLIIALQATGSFDAVLRTVGVIEYSPYDLTVSNLVLSAPSKNDDKSAVGSWTASMTVSVGSTSFLKTVAPTEAQP